MIRRLRRVICVLLTQWLLAAEAAVTCEHFGLESLICKPGLSDTALDRVIDSSDNKVTSVELKGCSITEVEYEAFKHVPSLQTLDLSHNKIATLKLGVLDEIHQLKHLNVSHNLLTELPLGLFDQSPNLIVLDLSWNRFNQLELGCLDGFHQLATLKLSNNQLFTFPLGIFDEKPHLKYLDLKGNKITDLELGIFDQMKELEHVDISYNHMLGKNLSSYIFDQSPVVKVLDLSGNDMTDSHDILLHAFTALEVLNLEDCSLVRIPDFAVKSNLKTMKQLTMSKNKISRLDDPNIFGELQNLEILNLAWNSISYVDDGVFIPLVHIKKINLSHNFLTQITGPVLFSYLPKLEEVDLSFNTLEIVSELPFTGSPIKILNLSFNQLTYLQENFCTNFLNSKGNLSEFYFNNNPWQCACLRDVIEEVKTHGISYQSSLYLGNFPACTTSNDFRCKRNLGDHTYFLNLFNSEVLPLINNEFTRL